MREFLYHIKCLISNDNVMYWPMPCDSGQWMTSDCKIYNSYSLAVNESKKRSLVKVEVKNWNEATQKSFVSYTYWSDK